MREVFAIIKKHKVQVYIAAIFLASAYLLVSNLDYLVPNEALSSTVGLALRGPFFLCVVILSVTHYDSWVSLLMKNRVLRWIGTRTYAIYLFHMPAIEGVKAIFRHNGINHLGLTVPFTALMLTLGFATMSWLLIEGPLIKLGHKRRYGHGAKLVILQPECALHK